MLIGLRNGKMIYLDTHIVVWLYDFEISRFSKKTLAVIEENELLICPAVMLELQYLREINRIKTDALLIVNSLKASINLKISNVSFEDVVNLSLLQTWTRDPFDRMIVGAAAVGNDTLITKDSQILKNYPNAFWK